MKRNLLILFILFLASIAGFYLVSTKPVESQVLGETVQSAPQDQYDVEAFIKEHGATGDVAEAYRFAKENPQQVLEKVHCYCGCIKQGHEDNLDCFINEDGSFNLMGLNCGLCVKTALTAKQMLSEGKTVEEIDQYVDQKWGAN